MKPVGRGDRAVVVAHAALLVADPVQGGDEVLHEAGVLLEDGVDAVGVDVLEAGEGGHARQVDEVLEDEADVAQRGGVLGHAPQGRPGVGVRPLRDEAEGEVAGGVGEELVELEAGRRQLALDAGLGELGADLGVEELAVVRRRRRGRAPEAGVLGALGAQVHLDPLLLARPSGPRARTGRARGRRRARG